MDPATERGSSRGFPLAEALFHPADGEGGALPCRNARQATTVKEVMEWHLEKLLGFFLCERSHFTHKMPFTNRYIFFNSNTCL